LGNFTVFLLVVLAGRQLGCVLRAKNSAKLCSKAQKQKYPEKAFKFK